MNATSETQLVVRPRALPIAGQAALTPFAREMVLIPKQELIELRCQAAYWEAQHARAKEKLDAQAAELLLKDAEIKDLKNRLFGKKSEKNTSSGSESSQDSSSRKARGQQQGTPGHPRTPRPNLPVVNEILDLSDGDKQCPTCGLPHSRRDALDETSDVIEVPVAAHIRRYHRLAYIPSECCCCPDRPAIITAPPPPRLLPRSPFGVSFWVEIMLGKFHYAQPIHRLLQDLRDQGLPVSPGTVVGGLKAIAPIFEPIMEALYCRQMNEEVFHNDETRWHVFVLMDGKKGTRWVLWVSRSQSVVYYNVDPSRGSAVPGAHFAGIRHEMVIIVCDRYSAYKKLARLSGRILLAFCWAHVRRDFLDAGRSMPALQAWALEWKERIATLYHLNALRLEHWQPDLPLDQQSAEFQSKQHDLQTSLQSVHDEAVRLVQPEDDKKEDKRPAKNARVSLDQRVAREQQRKIAQSLLEHWPGLSLFLTHPEVPMDNNLGENSLRGPAVGRKK
jgi:transposase